MLRLNGDKWIAVEFKLQDFWIGAFWKITPATYSTARGKVLYDLHIWICILPCFPIHFAMALQYERPPQNIKEGTPSASNNTGSPKLLQEAFDVLAMPCTTQDRVIARQKIGEYLQQLRASA